MKNLLIIFFAISIILFASNTAFCQPIVQIYASGLVKPIGISIDNSGNLWVGEQGTANNDSKISIITPGGNVFPFLTGLPSEIIQGEATGAEYVRFDVDGKLLIVQGDGSDSLSESILVVDTTGFTPGDSPLTIDDIEAFYNIGQFSISQGGTSTNPYRLAIGPNNDWFISDAGFNGVIRRDRNTGVLSVFTQLQPVVSTGIIYFGSGFYLGSLSSFPFIPGTAKVYTVDLSGNATEFQGGLSTIVDIAINPIDNSLFVLQHAVFQPPFLPNTGRLLRVFDGTVDTIRIGLNRPSGMVFNSNGELFISTLTDGNILKITNIAPIVPVELSSFSAIVNGGDVILSWSTATELNNNGFEIQRQINIEEFATIGFVKGAGTSTNQNNYSYADKDILAGKYFYRLKQIDYDGSFEYSSIIEIDNMLPFEYSVNQNYPNPFNPSTKISWQMPVSSQVSLKVYDVLGNEVATLVDEYKPAGSYEVEFDALQLSSGIYFYKLQAGSFVDTKKMILLR